MATQYDKIAKAYSDTQDKRKLRVYITDPTFFDVIGDLRGLEVLDLACGDGRLSRQERLRGASLVLGIDQEPKMIEIAQAIESQRNQGVQYRIGTVGELGNVGQFDLISAGFLFHYAKTREELEAMCRDAYVNLRESGRVVAINSNPNCPRNSFKKYGSTVTPTRDPPKEGDLIGVTLWDESGNQVCAPFYNSHWEKATYEEMFKKVGFKEVNWKDMHVSQEGIKKFGNEFWADWLGSPTLAILEAKK